MSISRRTEDRKCFAESFSSMASEMAITKTQVDVQMVFFYPTSCTKPKEIQCHIKEDKETQETFTFLKAVRASSSVAVSLLFGQSTTLDRD